jgi:hypothetical protein
MSNPGTPQQVQAVANACAQQRLTESIDFALTGDPSTDAISACLALVAKLNLSARGAALVFDYLKNRFRETAKELELYQQAGFSRVASAAGAYPGPVTSPVVTSSALGSFQPGPNHPWAPLSAAELLDAQRAAGLKAFKSSDGWTRHLHP